MSTADKLHENLRILGDVNHRDHHGKPWDSLISDTRYNVTEDGHLGEVYTVLRVCILVAIMFLFIFASQWWERRKQIRKKKGGRTSMLSDDEAASRGVEMSEMNAAATEAANEEDGLPAGESELGLTVRDGMEGVRDELAKIALSKYEGPFEQHGYDAWHEILRMPPHRIEKLMELVEMSPNHADRFKERLALQRKKYKLLQALPADKSEEACVIL